MSYENCWLANVVLESGFEYEGDLIIRTETELCNIKISYGKIVEIQSASKETGDDLPRINCDNLLALPAIREMHCHPDKTFLTQKWMAPRAATIADIIQKESDLMVSINSEIMEQRAIEMIELIKDAGSLFIRAHADVHDKVKLKNIRAVSSVLKNQKDLIGYEIVAFPQCGLFSGGTLELMKEALQNGANIVGGIDPHHVEEDADRALNAIMQLAVDHDAGIDLHLHELGTEGLYSMEKLADLTVEAGWQGRVSVSHAFALGSASDEEVINIAGKLKEAEIEIITCGLISDPVPKITLLNENGVNVRLGSDNIFDSWNPFGNGDLLERLGRVCQVFEWYDEYALSRSLKLITGGIVPLSEEGERIWPRVGDDATMILVDATCSPEAIARRASRKKYIVKGNVR